MNALPEVTVLSFNTLVGRKRIRKKSAWVSQGKKRGEERSLRFIPITHIRRTPRFLLITLSLRIASICAD